MAFSSIFPARLAGLALGVLVAASAQAAPGALPALKLDLGQTTVSGISSGAFMAVQMGVAHSASVRGVAATAGGPYFCALDDSLGAAAVSRAIGRCMQGDPDYRPQAIDGRQLARMVAATRGWGARGDIDPPAGLAGQSVWIFHGYNDGVVKKPVSDALRDWYKAFTPAGQIFYKDQLNAGHAQVSAACADSPGGSCNVCAQTGGRFINACPEPGQPGALYDAAGAALQLFYGPLERTATAALGGRLEPFAQAPFTRKRSGSPVAPAKIAMGDTGYVYRGKLDFEVVTTDMGNLPDIPVKIMMNVANPERAFDFGQLPNAGIGLARLEMIIASHIGIHPNALLEYDRQDAATKKKIDEKIAGFPGTAFVFVTLDQQGRCPGGHGLLGRREGRIARPVVAAQAISDRFHDLQLLRKKAGRHSRPASHRAL